jgi:hypothetical protein
MQSFIFLIIQVVFFLAADKEKNSASTDVIIAHGQMPNIVIDNREKINLVYGLGDSIMYSYSSDKGKTFASPVLISELPGLAASHTRGPQIAFTKNGLLVTACINSGNIFSYKTDASGKWYQTSRVNDVDTVAKENLMALSADGNNAFAVWLDLRDKHNKIYGAGSTDGGKTWSRNKLVYASPDATVCECCKPSVVVKGNSVYVMFRNWLKGNRDLYLIQSTNNGNTFGKAEKLGNGSWALNGCPMDGGSLAIGKKGNLQTVWNRKGTIYACEPGKNETELGKGRSCTLETVNGKNIYAWVENGEVVVLKPGGKEVLGKGQLPLIKAVDNDHVLCVWENGKQIHKALIEL